MFTSITIGDEDLGRCESCGAEHVEIQYISVGYKGLHVCARCYSEIERNKAEKEYYEHKKYER